MTVFFSEEGRKILTLSEVVPENEISQLSYYRIHAPCPCWYIGLTGLQQNVSILLDWMFIASYTEFQCLFFNSL